MNKLINFSAYILLAILSFFIVSQQIINANTSIFQDDVVVPNITGKVGRTSTSFEMFNDKYLIQTAETDDDNTLIKNYYNGDFDYLELSLFSDNQIDIYAGNDLDTIEDSTPIFSNSGGAGYNFRVNVADDYYLIKSDGRVDMRLITAQTRDE